MTDIVEKCRDHEDRFAKHGDHRTAHYFGEAADEIERLRALFEEIASHWDGYALKDLSAADVMEIATNASHPHR